MALIRDSKVIGQECLMSAEGVVDVVVSPQVRVSECPTSI